ncbi:exonuclease SbcC [Leeuwenhoekiella aestuarii]|uniref:Exonuclease SbcC n=1 Tax=Leeuwenhoekiella aestuarii TaxID=2249426 RepID=A0A4Q0NWJ6_9FLAO|nr:AAA family ATPase [Leeuwenhoekiella aestuarii]RXG15989.1 exonuclease SbcC [Leeuwenhoekiella aestuarii]RXG16683.1 exonuclease SbcC [Leeuwenhoekiella aestuarii]
MKILKIDFQNINSLRGEHHIDFTQEPFLQNTLFAITGPTGSGKTTILDVISLALFNQVPRLGKMSTGEILKKGAILTRNQSEAYARITYQCKTGIFASTWSISTARTGNLRDYHMEISNLETETILDLKKSDVPTKNEELIGLSYDQFIKSVVLAQGEFAKFLQVPKKERGALLEKITGTEIYRRIGQEVYLKHKERATAIEAKKAKIETFKEQLLDENRYTEKQQEAENLSAEKKQLQQELERLVKEIELKNKLQKEEHELQKTTEELSQLALQQKQFDTEKGAQLKKHQEIQLYADDLNRWQSLQEKSVEKQQEITTAKAAINKAEAQHEVLKKQFAETFNLAISPADFQEKTERYKAAVRELINARAEIATTYKTTKNHIESLAKPLQLEETLAKPETFQREVIKEQESKRVMYSKLATDFDLQNNSITQLQENLQQKLKQLRLAEKAETDLKNLKSQIQERQTELEKIDKEKSGLPDQLKEIAAKIELKEAQLLAKKKSLEVEQLQKKLEDYRRDLKDEEPCPLCGALHHPYAEHLPEIENGLQTEVTQLEVALKSLNSKQIEIQTSFNQKKVDAEALEKRIQVFTDQLKTAEIDFNTQFAAVLQERQDQAFSELEKDLEEQEQKLTQAKRVQEELVLLQNLKNETEALLELLTQGTQKAEAIKTRFNGSNFESEISTAENTWNRNEQILTQQSRTFKEAEKTNVSLKTQIQALTTSLLEQLRQKGYESIEDALKERLDASTAQNWTHEQQQLQNNGVRLKTLQQKLIDELKTLKETAGPLPLEELLAQRQTKAETLDQKEKRAQEVSRAVLNHKENLQKIKELQEQIENELDQSKHWQILFELIGDATGNKFNDFAQDLTLAQLLQLANKRLEQLTDRYRIDQPTGDEDDSLVAIDEHMGGQRRSIKTLSGGETFILSLALALALSDLASRNIEINSLFIDEGFGTLDPETLDQTLDTLEVLQAESAKMIGVISHVDSLKERIATQIQLTQNGQGYSTLKVV